ncbi:hypothetical protein TcBrA4_0120090 [Trypanosoma cruzi]|nr:hypothetical protein TcBrA4_0120090 [Trypanosoma cruzi]
MAAEGGPVAGGSGRKGNVNSEVDGNQEDEDGGENTAGEDSNPTPAGPLTAPTRQDQSSSGPLRSGTCNPSGTGSVSAARMRASGPESLGGGSAGGGRTSQGSQASEKNVTGKSQCQGRQRRHRKTMKEENPERNTRPTKPRK